MQIYDMIMVGVLIGAAAFGMIKGLAWQVAALGSLVASYFVALRFSPQLAELFGDHVPWNRFAAMALLYVLTGAGIWYLFRFVNDFMNRLKLRDYALLPLPKPPMPEPRKAGPPRRAASGKGIVEAWIFSETEL